MSIGPEWAGHVELARAYGDFETNVSTHPELDRIAEELHAQEHDEDGVGIDECDIDWHTDSWFRHRAAAVFNSGRGGR